MQFNKFLKCVIFAVSLIGYIIDYRHWLAGKRRWPGRVSPAERRCRHPYAESFRSVVRVAYPLTGALLVIGHSSADCVSGVGVTLQAFMSLVRVGPSVAQQAAYLLSKRSEDACTPAHLHISRMRGVRSQKMSHQTGINGRKRGTLKFWLKLIDLRGD